MLEFADLARTPRSAREGLNCAAHDALRNRARTEVAHRAIPGMFAVLFGTTACGVLSGHASDAPGAFAAVMTLMLLSVLARLPRIHSLRKDGSRCGWRDEPRFFLAALLMPLVWALYSMHLLLAYPDNWVSAAILAFTAAIASSVVLAFGMWRTLALCYIALLLVPTATAGLVMGSALGWGVTCGCAVFAGFLVAQVTNWNRFFWTSQLATAQLERHARELVEAKEAAEAANRAKSDFLTCMSHELRTPMNAVLGFAQLIELAPQRGDEVASNAREIRAAGSHLMDLIEEILDLSRIEQGHLALMNAPLDLRQIGERVIETLRGAAPPEVTLELVVEQPLPPCDGDALRVRQVLVNLVGNAVKFTPAGRVRLTLGGDDATVSLRVSDTGIGIRPELLDHIFAPFAQADSSTTRSFGGSGLGLAISRELVEAMGGTLTASSVPGKGSEFVATLPCRPTSAGPGEKPALQPDEASRGAAHMAASD